MLVLLETAAGFAIFKFLGDEERLEETENLYSDFETPEVAKQQLKLQHFERFDNTTEALAASKDLLDGKLSKLLKKTLRKCCLESEKQKLAVADVKLGKAIAEKLNFSCIATSPIQELMRCIRSQLHSFLGNVSEKEMTAMRLGLAHSLSRYKIKFSSEKIDTMVIQSICVLDDLDKQINNYIMRAREWFGWHFPELGKILKDNMQYIRTMKAMGLRDNVTMCDLSGFLSEELIVEVREAAETSMGSEISEYDAEHMRILCGEILELDQYRSDLKEYLTKRMMILAPNLTILVGDIVGARLISKAGSLKNLAKHPASTLQILGAEKALFRALKAGKSTPKYGLIYHARFVSSASIKLKGKASRMLAAKASLATRVDALGEGTSHELGLEHLQKLESRLRYLDKTRHSKLSGTAKAKAKFEQYRSKQEHSQYSASVDSTLPIKLESTTDGQKTKEKKKKKKHSLELASSTGESSGTQVKVKKEEAEADVSSKTKKKKKHNLERASDSGESSGSQVEIKEEADVSSKTKKKKKHSLERASDADESSGTQVKVKEEADVSLSKTKRKKKHSLERASDAGESSGMQIKIKEEEEEEADVSVSKPKKKKKHSLEVVGESSSSSSTQEKSDDVSKKKKIEDSSKSMFLSPSPKKMKKRKHSSAGQSSVQEKSHEEIDSSLLSESTEQETTMEETDSQHEQSFGEPKKKKKKKKSKEPKV